MNVGKVLNGLNALTAEELLLVNKATAKLWQERETQAKASLRKGTTVCWTDHHGTTLTRKVTRRNKTWVNVVAEDGTKWRGSATRLNRV